ncbi:MAG: diacylglycerol kinase family protein [Anaerolineales bacterium]
MFSFLKSRWESIKIAFAGLLFVIRTQKNAWVHLSITALVIFGGVLVSLSRLEWVAVVITLGMVWAAETFNTAMEVLIDYVSPEQRPVAKTCKDISAAGVLIAALMSILVGVLVFGPRLWGWLWALTGWE